MQQTALATDAPPSLLASTLRLITFRLTPQDFHRFTCRHLLLGLLATWIVGIDRRWSTPDLPSKPPTTPPSEP